MGILIPPSVTFILYGIATETSIGRLFIAGVLPGLMLTGLFMLWTVFLLWKRGFRSHDLSFRYSWKEKFQSIPKIEPFLFIILVEKDVGLILVGTALISTLSTFFAPAEAAMIPFIVERRQLLAANSLYVFTLQAAFFVGFAILGPLTVNLAGQTATLVVVAALFVIAAAACLAPGRRADRRALARMQIRKTDCLAHSVEFCRSVELAHRFAFDPALGRGEKAHLSFSHGVHVSFCARQSGIDVGGWPPESELRRHLLGFSQACRLTTPSSGSSGASAAVWVAQRGTAR